MKFARLLEYHTIPEWSAYYIDYRFLKRLLRAYRASKQTFSHEISESLLGKFDALQELNMEIESQCNKANEFYISKLSSLHQDIDSIRGYIYNLKRVSSINQIEASVLLSMKERDENQSRATSMQRAFTELHQRIVWLESYCEFNYISVLKIMEKFDGGKIKVEDLRFKDWVEDLEGLKEVIYDAVASECLKCDKETVKKMIIETKHYKIADLQVFSFCLGVLFVLSAVLGWILVKEDLSAIKNEFFMFRLLFFVSFTIIVFSVVVYFLEKYSVNWLFIFEIAPVNKISYFNVLSSGIAMLTLWMLTFALHLSTEYYYPLLDFKIIPSLTIMIYLCILFCPFNIFSKNARVELLILMWNVIIAPFGAIRFKNYMVGSWLTSMVVPLKDVYLTILILYSHHTGESFDPSQYILVIISVLPFTWRILQNVKRVIYQKSLLLRQALNFVRYVISIGLIFTAFFDLYTHPIWVAGFIIGTIAISWLDVRQDWQLNIGYIESSKNFNKSFLYFAVVSNFLLRFIGILSLMPVKVLENPLIPSETALTFFGLLELLRRMQWSIIRIERERRDNKENFRDIQYIPITFTRY